MKSSQEIPIALENIKRFSVLFISIQIKAYTKIPFPQPKT